MGGEALAPGFRFHPTDEELVGFYLKRKVLGKTFRFDAISEIDIYRSEPWDLPGYSKLKSRDLEWYFFSALDKKYGNGWRTNRATSEGYWKTTGKDRTVKRGERLVGMKKTLVFHIGRAPKGERTNWVMHEYRLEDEELKQHSVSQDAFVLCKIFHKSGAGPRNGDQYGAPLVEEEWENEDLLVAQGVEMAVYDVDHMDNDQNFAVQLPSGNALPVGYVGESSCNNLIDYGDTEDDHKPFLGTADCYGATGEQFLTLPEEFRMVSEPVENEFFEMDDLAPPLNAGDLDSTGSYHDTSLLVQSLGNELFVDDLNPVDANLPEFENFEDCFKYFDANENDNFDFSEFLEYDISNQPSPVEVNRSDGEESTERPSEEGSSSSVEKQEKQKVLSDVEGKGAWNSTFTKHLSSMLESFSAPPAYALENPTKTASATQSSSVVHVTASMIHVTLSGSRKSWSMEKSGEDSDFLGPYSITGNAQISFSSKAGSLVIRSTCFVMFLWVLVLSLSCKFYNLIYAKS